MTELLWDPRLTELKVCINTADTSEPYWKLIAAFVTLDGNWDSVPGWAKQYQQDTLGGATHVFGRAYNCDGTIAEEAGFILTWADGDALRTPEPNGWANLPINAGYNWQAGPGPFSWQKYGNADVLTGIGLPYPPLPWEFRPTKLTAPLGGVHVSFFGVWEDTPPDTPTPSPPPPCTECPLWENLPWLLREVADWVEDHLSVD